MNKIDYSFWSEDQTALYKAASLIEGKVLATPEDHLEAGTDGALWTEEDTELHGERYYWEQPGTVAFIETEAETWDNLHHENADCLLYDADTKMVHFENVGKEKAESYTGDSWQNPQVQFFTAEGFAKAVNKARQEND